VVQVAVVVSRGAVRARVSGRVQAMRFPAAPAAGPAGRCPVVGAVGGVVEAVRVAVVAVAVAAVAVAVAVAVAAVAAVAAAAAWLGHKVQASACTQLTSFRL
jgi:hypothetical protein